MHRNHETEAGVRVRPEGPYVAATPDIRERRWLDCSCRLSAMASAGHRPGGQLPDAAQPTAQGTALASFFPSAIAAIPQEERALAERVLVAPRLSARDEDLAEVLATAADGALGFLIVEGIVIKKTTLATRSALEMLSVGDILAPPLTEGRQAATRAVSRYFAHGTVSLAVLQKYFRAASRRWPVLADALHGRLARQTHRASAHVALLHEPRVHDRIELLFTDLAERCGRVTRDGILIDIPLTHELIGRLVAAQRPTVTLALADLARAGTLRRVEGEDGWIMRGDTETVSRAG